MNKPFNKLLKELIEMRGVSQKTLSRQTGLTESAVSHYIKGDRFPKRTTIITLSKTLNVPPDLLFNSEFPRSPMEESFDALKETIIKNRSNYSKEQKLEIISLLID